MSYTQADLTNIQNAIVALAKGERVVSVSTSNGKSITYGQSQLKDLQALRDSIRTELDNSSSTTRRFVLIQTDKGL